MKIETRSILRLAVVGPYPLNPAKVAGGIQAVVRNLVQGLKRFQDLEIHVVTVDFDRQEALVPQQGVQVHVLHSKQGISQFTFYRQERQWIKSTLEQIHPDVVHVHGTNFYGYAALGWDFPTVFTVHSVLQQEGRLNYQEVGIFHRIYRGIKGSFNIFFDMQTLKYASDIIVISPYIGKMLKDFLPKHLYSINNPIDELYFQLEDLSLPGRILFAGLIHVRKGILNLIKAVEIVRSQQPNIELHLAGKVQESEYEAVLRSYIRDHHLEKQVIFRGHLNDQDLFQAFAECQILVLPSQEEVSPMVIQQAMAAGKPVIATAVGGVPYLVESGSSGLLVPYGDPQALSQAILRLLADPKEAARMGARGRTIAKERFREESICTQTRAVYYNLAKIDQDN